MKFKTIDGREVSKEVLPSEYPIRSEEDCKSKGQYNLGQRLLEIFPQSAILEEFSIPGSKLRIDFLLPRERLAFEFQGGQHFKFNRFFHDSKEAFLAALGRDKEKYIWCELNSIKLVYVVDSEISCNSLKGSIIE